MKEKIQQFFNDNKINISIEKSIKSYQVTTYYCKISEYNNNIINKIIKLQDILCLYLQVNNININFDKINGYLLIEIENTERATFLYNDLIQNNNTNKDGLYFNIGIKTNNIIKNINLCNTPHLLIAGTTGSGKSVLVNNIILQLLENYTPKELELILIDIKQVEFSIYKNIPHLLYDPITTLEKSRIMLYNIINEMNERYKILKDNNNRNIAEYNKTHEEKIKYKVVIIDELAELLMLEQNKLKSNLEGYDTIEKYICRIAQLGRAAGIHLIVATQRPSSDIISGLIKNNIPSRIALSVPSAINSKIILDEKGAEKLSGNGDMLLKLVNENKLERLQGAYITEEEIIKRLENIKNKYNYNNTIILTEYKDPKEELLKKLENYISICFSKSESKIKCYNLLMQNNNIQGIIQELSKNEKEQEILKDNYFNILKSVKQFYNGYIQEEKQEEKDIKQNERLKEKQEKLKRRDRIASNIFIAKILNDICKHL